MIADLMKTTTVRTFIAIMINENANTEIRVKKNLSFEHSMIIRKIEAREKHNRSILVKKLKAFLYLIGIYLRVMVY